MSAPPPGQPILRALREASAFEPLGERAGNVTLGRGRVNGRAVHVALVENHTASGSIGTVEVQRLSPVFRIVAKERSPLVLFLDSAGAKVSEGLPALGAFRRVYREALGAALAGAPIAAVLGKNCYGGSSMLAHLARSRLFSANTQLAMSGPSILAATAGMDVLDEMFRAMAESAISAGSRVKASPGNTLWDPATPLEAWLAQALSRPANMAGQFRLIHQALGARLPADSAGPAWEPLMRRDLERLYPEGYEAKEQEGLIVGAGRTAAGGEAFVGLIGKSALGAVRAWKFAEAAWRHLESPPGTLRLFLDCASHAARLDDERLVLSEYIVGMSLPLVLLAVRGTKVELTILGAASGGVYVALAGAATRVTALHGAQIQVLPGTALAAILGGRREETASWDEYAAAGVADEELKLGIV